ncbi:hypothetical protein SASPL_118590 [Salvia splendens]|uniref:WD and tetratricopeptide repeats protein 1 n=1 Tax=Salvia splendens TaxID=180675 RepID=A0A8X8XZN8_SALSN|nr:hypothetical protein SASPL_118590 [Salvia splendens]
MTSGRSMRAFFRNTVRYTSRDVSKLTSLSPKLDKAEVKSSFSGVSLNGFPVRNKAAGLDKCRKLIRFAEKSLKGETDRYYGIEACNEVLDGHGYEIDPTLVHECLCIRASLLLKRRWKNDSHMAIRDCHGALKLNPSSTGALICMAEALSMLEKHKEALEFAFAAQSLAPSDFEIMERVEHIKKSSAAAEADKSSMESDKRSTANYRAKRVLSLSDIIYHTEGENDNPSGPEREDSDYDDELELDFETLIPAEGGHDVESDVLPGNLNLRIHRRGDLNLNAERVTGSFGSPVSSCEDEKVPKRSEMAIDMKQRYVGHCNTGTDIKQASFIGQRGEYIASGSDDGRWFIWEKKTGRLLKMLHGDDAVVNCIQCHPYDCVIATSGIDSTIKIWTPTSPVPSSVAGDEGPEPSNVLEAMEENQRRLYCTREAILYCDIGGSVLALKGDFAICPLKFWSVSECMSLQKEVFIHLSAHRVDKS